MIEREPGIDWQDLQRRVALILHESGMTSETSKTLDLARGKVEVDVYAVDPRTTPPAVYLCECKRWHARVPQSEVQTFRTVIADSGAHFGLFISSEGFQAGAFEVVRHTNIHLLDWQGFQQLFLERWCANYWVPTLRLHGYALADYVDPVHSDAPVREAHGEPLDEAEAAGLFVSDMWGYPLNNMLEVFLGIPSPPVAPAIWEHRDKYKQYLPPSVANAQYLRELLDALLAFANEWPGRTGRSGSL